MSEWERIKKRQWCSLPDSNRKKSHALGNRLIKSPFGWKENDTSSESYTRVTMWFTILFWGIYLKELKTETQTDTYTPIFIAALVTTAKPWKQYKSLSRWLERWSVVYAATEYNSALRKEWRPDACSNIHEPWSYYVKWNSEPVKLLSRVQLFVIPGTVAYWPSPSMAFSRQENWSGLPFPSPGDLPDPGIEPRSPALQADTNGQTLYDSTYMSLLNGYRVPVWHGGNSSGNRVCWSYPGGSVVKNPPANARNMGWIPDPGRSPCLGAAKPVHHNCWVCALEPVLEPVLGNKKSHCNEKPTHSNED